MPGLLEGAAESKDQSKGDERKAVLATLLRRRTTVGLEWIASRLRTGHPGSVSRQVGNVKRDRKPGKRSNEREKCCSAGTDPRSQRGVS